MAENTKKCPKDCMQCHPNQRLYCAAFMSRLSIERLDQLEAKVAQLDHTGDSVFNPMAKKFEPAQQGIGAENRMPLNEPSNKKDNEL